jgi:AcrR family transcriptional regulator
MPLEDLELKIGSKRPAGRPRSEASRLSILETAYSFLKRKPIADISTVHIARKAGVSTATVYRWWPTKEALLLDAFLYKTDHEIVLPGEGRPLERLRDYVLQIGRFFTGKNGIVVARLITAIQDNSLLRKEFVRRVYSPRDREGRALVRQAIEERQLPAGTDVGLLLDAVVGPLLSRLLLRHEKLDEDFVRAVYDHVIASAAGRAAS